jgi:hypothetical protein
VQAKSKTHAIEKFGLDEAQVKLRKAGKERL